MTGGPEPAGATAAIAQRGLSAARGAPAIDAQAAFVAVTDGVYRIEASLTFATVTALHAPGLERIDAGGAELQFDLRQVAVTDSAGLALLVDWLAEARLRRRRLRYVQPPQALLALARLSEVDSLIVAGSAAEPQR